jgi:hypothetical protein
MAKGRLIVLLSVGAACGGGGGSGVPPSTPLGSLNAEQSGKLCDAVNGAQGGYGRSVQCPGGTETADSSHESCVSLLPGVAAACPTLTAGDLEGCAEAIGTDLCKFGTDVACANARDCFGG